MIDDSTKVATYGEKISSRLYIYEGVGDIGIEQVKQTVKEHIELTGRTCYTVELDPKYCDVIIQRWELATGNKAVRIDGATE